jgi:hypothetical protein
MSQESNFDQLTAQGLDQEVKAYLERNRELNPFCSSCHAPDVICYNELTEIVYYSKRFDEPNCSEVPVYYQFKRWPFKQLMEVGCRFEWWPLKKLVAEKWVTECRSCRTKSRQYISRNAAIESHNGKVDLLKRLLKECRETRRPFTVWLKQKGIE